VIVSHTKKFIFIKTSKTGGSSFQYDLSKQCSLKKDLITAMNPSPKGHRSNRPVEMSHLKANQIKEIVGGEVFNKYFIFSIIRNPWDYAVSLFWWHKYCGNKEDWEHLSNNDFSKIQLSFEKWMPRYVNESHDNSSFFTIKNKIIADYVCRYEKLEEEYEFICDRVDIKHQKLSKIKGKSRKRPEHYSQYFNLKTRNTVAVLNKYTLDQFGYHF
jgi:hypothetical protein